MQPHPCLVHVTDQRQDPAVDDIDQDSPEAYVLKAYGRVGSGWCYGGPPADPSDSVAAGAGRPMNNDTCTKSVAPFLLRVLFATFSLFLGTLS
jgi:hypothetical protein